MRNTPVYAIGSVDSALRLATLLQLEGPLRVTDAAARLGVSASTAHRLLTMLVHHDYAEQQPDRRYDVGPVLRRGPGRTAPAGRLRELALPLLHSLVDELGESANVMVVSGPEARFVATVECEHALRVGDRTGRRLPSHRVSGGKAVLATLDEQRLAAVLDVLHEPDVQGLVRELQTVRRRGFAVNDRQTEAGLTAVGVVVPTVGTGIALSVAAPTARVTRGLVTTWAGALRVAAAALAGGLGAT